MRRRKGVAILIALGVLTFLSFVGVSFTIGSILSLKSAFNYYYTVRAKMAAEAGIARAIAELRLGDAGATADALDIDSPSYNGSFELSRGLTGQYSVTAVDCASRINLNDGNPNLAQILKNLKGLCLAPQLTDADCDNIASHAPYSAKEEIKLYISGAAQQEKEDKYASVEGFLTVFGFIDTAVVNPADVSIPYAAQPRAPVNVNTAPKEVIQAVLTGIRAVHACPKCGGDGQINGPSSNTACDSCSSGTLEIDSAEADQLAQYIVSHRPYSNWSQFYLSVKNCGSIGPRDADLVAANANPNTGFSWIRNLGWASKMGYLGKYLIDWNKNGVADASDKGVTVNTTEFSFNSGGYYEITSAGEVNRSGLPLARKSIVCVVKIFDIYRLTSQQQFEASGSSKSEITTYPEPVEAQSTEHPAPAAYDGQIMLAKKTTGGPDSSDGPGWFNAPYRVSLDAQAAGGNKTPSDVPGGGSTGTKPNLESVANFSDRGDLMPDGMLVDMFDKVRAAYRTPNNILAGSGTLEIWFKTQWNSLDSRIYGTGDIDRKMLRLTSGAPIEGFTDPNGVPYITFFIWSDGGGTYASAKWGGGAWNPGAGTWGFAGCDFKWGDTWFGWPYGGVGWGHWDAGKWNHLAITWINPSPIKGNPEGTYDTTVCPIYIYFNGEKKLLHMEGSGLYMDNTYYYHNDYADNNDINYDFMCGNEYSKWNTNWGTFEFSDSVIGSVWIWNNQRSDIQVNADMNNGLYVAGGTYSSPVFEPGRSVRWGTATWTQSIPDEIADEGGGIAVSVDTTGTGSSWTGDWDNPSTGRPINVVSDKIAVRAKLSATDTETIPEVDNLLSNGGFETGDLAGWTPDGIGAPLGQWVTSGNDGSFPYGGSGYHFYHRDEWGCKGGGGVYQEFSCLNGAQYRLNGYFMCSGGGWQWHCDLVMYFYDKFGNMVSSRTVTAPGSTGSYTNVDTGWIAAPAGAATVRAGVKDYGTFLPFWIAWDSLQLQQKAISTTGIPALETPVLDDVTVTYLQEAQVLYRREF